MLGASSMMNSEKRVSASTSRNRSVRRSARRVPNTKRVHGAKLLVSSVKLVASTTSMSPATAGGAGHGTAQRQTSV